MSQPRTPAQENSSHLEGFLDRALEATVVGSFTRIGPEARRRLGHWQTFPNTPGRVVVVTGASSGLGKQAAKELAELGCTVVIVGRNQSRLDEVAAEITGAGGSVVAEQTDLADLEQTVDLSDRLLDRFGHIDVLVNNAGALLNTFTTGPQGHEVTVTVHLLSPFVLTSRLEAAMDSEPRSKVITMTSGGMYTEPFDLTRLEMTEQGYRGSVAYARAKRAQVVLNQTLQRLEPDQGRTFSAVHPGWARTPGVAESLPTFQKVLGPLLRSPAEGVDTLVWLATLPEGQPEGGLLWLDRLPRAPYRLKKTKVDPVTEVRQGDELLAWLREITAPFLDRSH